MSKYAKGVLITLLGGACWGLSGTCSQYLCSVQGMDTRWVTVAILRDLWCLRSAVHPIFVYYLDYQEQFGHGNRAAISVGCDCAVCRVYHHAPPAGAQRMAGIALLSVWYLFGRHTRQFE